MVSTIIDVFPAYGRKYESQAIAFKDWCEGKDFKIFEGPYCSARDQQSMIDQYGIYAIRLHYNLSKDPMIIILNKGDENGTDI